MGRAILHAVEIHAEPSTIFDAIATQRGQTGFWTTDAQVEPTVGSVASFGFPGTAERMNMRIQRLEPGNARGGACEGHPPRRGRPPPTREPRPPGNPRANHTLSNPAGLA